MTDVPANGRTLLWRVTQIEDKTIPELNDRIDTLVKVLVTLGIGLVAGMGGLIASLIIILVHKGP